jgi:hypothetical protein
MYHTHTETCSVRSGRRQGSKSVSRYHFSWCRYSSLHVVFQVRKQALDVARKGDRDLRNQGHFTKQGPTPRDSTT